MNKQTNVSSSVRVRNATHVQGREFLSFGDEEALRWQHITRLLGAGRSDSGAASQRVRSTPPVLWPNTADCRYETHATIVILERPSPSTVVVSWRDATRCSYGYQYWYKGFARRGGTCAMSGVHIRRGDVVFRPRRTNVMPANMSAMILAEYATSPDACKVD